MEAGITALKADLNAEFGQQADTDMFAITVTRTPIISSNPAPLISHSEFEQVLKLLYASCVNPGCWLTRWWRGSEAAIPPLYSRDGIVLNGIIDNGIDANGGLPAKTVSAVDFVKENIGRSFLKNNMRDACKLVVFNEMFFSQLEPLDTDQENFIERKIFDLSRSSPNTVFYPNFLYTETRNVPGSTVHGDLVRMGTNTSARGLAAIRNVLPASVGGAAVVHNPNMVFNDERRSLRACALEVNRRGVPNDGTLIDWEYLVNETHAINNGNVLTKYRKVGYFGESDSAIERGVLYDSGPGYDEAVLTGPHTLRDRLLRNISIDICLDLNLGIRRGGVNHWINPGVMAARDSSLHLIQSNSINPFYDCDLNPRLNLVNRRNLPHNRGILHVDKYPHPSWNIPGAVNRPQDVYLPYFDTAAGDIKDDFLCCKDEFHLRIVESDYRFSFLRI
jgi:hypothetical protein